MSRPEKILALQFKYLGDTVQMTPALRAVRAHFPAAELHVLVPAELAPLLAHLPWIDRVWAMPRRRGQAGWRETLPLLRALRRERFDRSVDFASNDRGALVSFCIGARQRLGWDDGGGFLGRKYLYHRFVVPPANPPHETLRLAMLSAAWQVPLPQDATPEIHPDPALAAEAEKILPSRQAVVCHLATSQPKKEWPLTHWAELHRLLRADGREVVFTTASGERELALTAGLRPLAPDAVILPLIPKLPLFMAVLARAGVLVSGDTGPLHLAVGLGVRTVSLFGPTLPLQVAPRGPRHEFLKGGNCGCDGNSAVCTGARHCLADITPAQVAAAVASVVSR